MNDAHISRTKKPHDAIYTILLAVLAFFYVITGFGMWFVKRDQAAPEARLGFSISITAIACYVLAMLAILVIRIGFPAARKWPTLALNIILVPLIPVGTALAIYGFWKVDKAAPDPATSPV